jgi:broad specificity phosphatase PhoE
MLVDFIRHGEPVGGRRYRGSGVDDPLSKVGWQQRWQAVGEPRLEVKLITSPLRRCHDFASALAQRDGLALVLEEHFCEIGMGAWEGLTNGSIPWLRSLAAGVWPIRRTTTRSQSLKVSKACSNRSGSKAWVESLTDSG